MISSLLLLLQLQGVMPGFTPQTYTVFMKLGNDPAAVQLQVVLVAPKVLAVVNFQAGQDAYDECMQTLVGDLQCTWQKASAIQADALKRLEIAWRKIFSSSGTSWQKAFEESQLILLPL